MQQDRGLFSGLSLYTQLYKLLYNKLLKQYVSSVGFGLLTLRMSRSATWSVRME